MKQLVSVLLLLTPFSVLFAQPVIERDDVLEIGQTFRVSSTGVIPSPGQSGADRTWDFSDLEKGASATYFAEDPSGSDFEDDYPDANLLVTDMQGGAMLFQYQRLTNDAWEEHGVVMPNSFVPTQLTYEDPKTYLEFPLAYNNQWQDFFEYTLVYQISPPFVAEGEGTLNARADAYGELLLPQATFGDVLRIRTISISSDFAQLGSGLFERNDFIDTTYIWISPAYHAPLCTHFSSLNVRTTLVVSSGDTSEFVETFPFKSFTYDPSAMPSSAVREEPTDAFALQVYPNPIGEMLHFQFTQDRPAPMQVLLTDVHGRLVYEEKFDAVAGEQHKTVSLPFLTDGNYMMHLRSAEGVSIRKISRVE